MSQLFDLVGFTTTTTGTGTITVAAALSGHRTMAGASIADGTVVSYGISSNGGAARETGTGTVGGSGATLTRTLAASSTGALLNLSGTSEVYITPLAADMTPGGTTGALQMATSALNFGASNISQDASGRITVAAGTQTTAGSALTLSYTANGSGQTINGLTVNMTDTASASGSLPLDVQINGVSRLIVRKSDGGVAASNGFYAGTTSYRASGVSAGDWNATFGWTSGASLNHNGSGQLWLSYGTATVFGLGGNTNAFPSLKRSGTSVQIRLADDSAFAPLSASLVQTVALTVATLPAAASWPGAEAYVTDANAPAVGSTVASGGSGRARVGSNGTNWIVTSVI